jgi:hypothetical protein
MQQSEPRIVYYPIPFIIRHPLSPININTVLPSHIQKVIGVKAVHSVGAEQMLNVLYLPVIGHLSLEFNSRQYHLGNMDIPFDNRPESNDGFLTTDIAIVPNSLVTGNYENKICTNNEFVLSDNSTTANWRNYIITLYLMSWSND